MKENILVFENIFEPTSGTKGTFMATSSIVTVGTTATKETSNYNTAFPGALISSRGCKERGQVNQQLSLEKPLYFSCELYLASSSKGGGRVNIEWEFCKGQKRSQ